MPARQQWEAVLGHSQRQHCRAEVVPGHRAQSSSQPVRSHSRPHRGAGDCWVGAAEAVYSLCLETEGCRGTCVTQATDFLQQISCRQGKCALLLDREPVQARATLCPSLFVLALLKELCALPLAVAVK